MSSQKMAEERAMLSKSLVKGPMKLRAHYFILNIALVLQITYFIQHRKVEDRGKDD